MMIAPSRIQDMVHRYKGMMKGAGEMKKIVIIFLVGLVMPAFAGTIRLQGAGDIWDATIVGTATNNDATAGTGILREYWGNNTTYDIRLFMKIDLSSIPQDSIITNATLGLYYIDAWGGVNVNHLMMGYTSDAFTTDCNWTTYDGTHPWTDGNGAGVDPYNNLYPHNLVTIVLDPAVNNIYTQLTSVGLVSYIQTQVNAGQDAYLQFSIDDTDGKYQRVYLTEAPAAYQPYLDVDVAPKGTLMIIK